MSSVVETSHEISPLTPFLRPSGGKRAKLELGRDDKEGALTLGRDDKERKIEMTKKLPYLILLNSSLAEVSCILM